MAYDERLAERVRDVIEQPAEERTMFGGLAFLLGGHMAICVSGQGGLMVRVSDHDHASLLERDHVGPMTMGGRTSRTWVRVSDEGLRSERQLETWVRRGEDVARSLPPKQLRPAGSVRSSRGPRPR